jgi:hypothetical protein
MTINDITAASVLTAAIDYCDEHGWKRGSEGPHGGSRCMIGAVDSVRRDQNGFMVHEVDTWVRKAEGAAVAEINDKYTSWPDCKARFVKVVEKLRGNGG